MQRDFNKNKLIAILSTNLFALLLLITWYLPSPYNLWLDIDNSVFYFFNQLLLWDNNYVNFVALINHRGFDIVTLMVMGSLLFHQFIKQDTAGKYRIIAMGILMILTALILNQIGRLLPVERTSPTLVFENINRVSELSSIQTKDSSTDSFPSDHGLMLLIFAGFMWCYFGIKTFFIALFIMVVFSLPRIMSGSHWFTDIYVGSVFTALIGLSWLFLTPLNNFLIKKIVHFLVKTIKI